MMFTTAVTGSVLSGWKASIYERADLPANTLIATVYGYSEAITEARVKAVFEALQQLEK